MESVERIDPVGVNAHVAEGNSQTGVKTSIGKSAERLRAKSFPILLRRARTKALPDYRGRWRPSPVVCGFANKSIQESQRKDADVNRTYPIMPFTAIPLAARRSRWSAKAWEPIQPVGAGGVSSIPTLSCAGKRRMLHFSAANFEHFLHQQERLNELDTCNSAAERKFEAVSTPTVAPRHRSTVRSELSFPFSESLKSLRLLPEK